MTGQGTPADKTKTDSELAVSALGGNERDFREIISRFRPRILSICLRMLKNQTEATEAAQDTFVKIYFHLRDYDPEKSFSSWAASIAINECRDRLRKRARFSQTFRELTERFTGIVISNRYFISIDTNNFNFLIHPVPDANRMFKR